MYDQKKTRPAAGVPGGKQKSHSHVLVDDVVVDDDVDVDVDDAHIHWEAPSSATADSRHPQNM